MQRVDFIHTPVAKIEEREDKETKDKQSISKSNINTNTNTNTENTVDISMAENSVMSASESKKAQKIKADQLLADEYLNYLQGKAQQAFLSLVNLISELGQALEERTRKLGQLRNTFFCRLIEDPFKLPMRDPSSIFRDDFVYSNFNMNILENMLTAFQLHPCQLVNLIQPGIVDPSRQVLSPKDFTDFVWQIFGSIHCDHRKESLYVMLVDKVLTLELGDEKSSERVAFFEGDDFESMNERDVPKVRIQYTNELVNRAISKSFERVLELDKTYSKIYAEINQKTKSIIDSSQRPYAFVMWEEGSLRSRYSAESGTWKVDEFNERINNLYKLLTTLNDLVNDQKIKPKSLTSSLLNKMHTILSKSLKDYREKEKYRLLCGYVLLPLGKKIENEVKRMDNATKERMQLNLKHTWLFLMHFYSGTKITLPEEAHKDSDKWIPKLNDIIFNPHESMVRDVKTAIKAVLSTNKDRGYDNIMVNIDNDVEMNSPKNRQREQTKEEDMDKSDYKPDEQQITIFKNFIFYITQIFELSTERVSVQKHILHKVFRACLDFVPMGDKVPAVELFYDVELI